MSSSSPLEFKGIEWRGRGERKEKNVKDLIYQISLFGLVWLGQRRVRINLIKNLSTAHRISSRDKHSQTCEELPISESITRNASNTHWSGPSHLFVDPSKVDFQKSA